MMQRRFSYLLYASLLIVAVASFAQREEAIALQLSEMKEPRQRTPRSVRRRTNKPVYQHTSSLEEMADNSRSLISLPELNTSTDIENFIHSPLGKDILSSVVGGQDNSIFAKVSENPKFLWESENKVMNFREEKQHYPKEESTQLSPQGNNKGFKEKLSNSLTTVMIISPALLPGQEEYEMDEWNFRDPRITSEHQVIRLNVNKGVQELLTALSSVQPGEVRSHHRTVRSKQPRTFSESSEETLPHYSVEYTQYPASSPPYSNDYYYYEYPQDDSLDKEINEPEYETIDYDYHDDMHFKDDFSAANLGRIASHKYNQLRFFWDLFHHGWPFWLEK